MRAMAIPQTSALPLIGSAAPEPQAAPKPPTPAGGAKSFASLLRQNRPVAAPASAAQAPRPGPVPRPNERAAADDAPPAPNPAPHGAARTAAPPPRPTPARPTPARAEPHAEDGAARTADAAKDSAREATQAGPAAPDPSLMQALTHLHLTPEAAGAGADATTTDTDAAAEAATGASPGSGALGAVASGAAQDARAEARATLADAAEAAGAAAGGLVPVGAEPAAAAMTTERRRLEPSTATLAPDGASPFGALGSLAAAPPPRAGSAVADAVPVTLTTPVDSPDFPQMLGVQLSVLAEGGVQHAELHLNPADMGPVSVQITMDGTAARIDFGVDVAATRHAIEAGLPELAGALRDAGFTLTGGGVSEHAGGGREGSGGAEAGPRGGPATGVQAEPAPVPRRTVAVGGLDLYA